MFGVKLKEITRRIQIEHQKLYLTKSGHRLYQNKVKRSCLHKHLYEKLLVTKPT